MSVEENLKNLNLTIPKAPDPVGNYLAYVRSNNLIFISGQLPIDTNGKLIEGNIASDLIVNIFKEKGKHARAVVGVSSLPLNAAVELETVFEI